MRVLACGGRKYSDRNTVFEVLDRLSPETVVHGAAGGAGTLAGEWARVRGRGCMEYPADWGKYGRSAGPVRNRRMLREGAPDLVVAFPGVSGTEHMIETARQAGVPLLQVASAGIRLGCNHLSEITPDPVCPDCGCGGELERSWPQFRDGDMLAQAGEFQAVVNPVNCVGIMGAGLARGFKARYPVNFQKYAAECRRGLVRVGKMTITIKEPPDPAHIVNFPTKRHWRDDSRLEDIEAGLWDLRKQLLRLGVQSIALPALGCGLGGLDWDHVRPLINLTLSAFWEKKVVVFNPT